MRNVITALTASARRSPETGFGKSGAPGTSLRMRLTVSGSVYPVTKTIRASHASRSFLATSIPSCSLNSHQDNIRLIAHGLHKGFLSICHQMARVEA